MTAMCAAVAGMVLWMLPMQEGEKIWEKLDNPSSGMDQPTGVAFDSTGIYVVGYAFSTPDRRWRVQKRSRTDGSPIWTQTVNLTSGNDSATAVAVDATGAYIVGYTGTSSTQWRIEKRDLDTGAQMWAQTVSLSGTNERAYAVCVHNDVLYVVGWNLISGSNYQWNIQSRDTATGAQKWAVTSNPSAGGDLPLGVAADDTGVYVIGDVDRYTSKGRWRYEKRSLVNGTMIWWTESNPSSNADAPWSIAIDAEGLYVAGDDSGPGANRQWRIERRDLNDGSLVWAQTKNYSSLHDSARAIAVDADSIYLGGFDQSPGEFQWRTEKRLKSDGTLLWEKTLNPDPTNTAAELIRGIAVDGPDLFQVGTDLGNLNGQWRIELLNSGAVTAKTGPAGADDGREGANGDLGVNDNLCASGSSSAGGWGPAALLLLLGAAALLGSRRRRKGRAAAGR